MKKAPIVLSSSTSQEQKNQLAPITFSKPIKKRKFYKPLRVDEVALKRSKIKKQKPSKNDEELQKALAQRREKKRLDSKRKRMIEKKFRENIKKAFNIDEIEIVPKEKLPYKIDGNSFSEGGKLSNFPFNFEGWVRKGEESAECKGESNKSRSSVTVSLKSRRKRERIEKAKVYHNAVDVLEKSKVVNLEAGSYMAQFMGALKEIKKICS